MKLKNSDLYGSSIATDLGQLSDIEVVAWALPGDLVQDGYTHTFSVCSEEYQGRVPLIRLSDLNDMISIYSDKLKGLMVALDKIADYPDNDFLEMKRIARAALSNHLDHGE